MKYFQSHDIHIKLSRKLRMLPVAVKVLALKFKVKGDQFLLSLYTSVAHVKLPLMEIEIFINVNYLHASFIMGVYFPIFIAIMRHPY